MRYTYLLLIFFLVHISSAQFRGMEPKNPSIQDGVVKPSSENLMFGFFNPDKFTMNHSVSMSYMSLGGQSVGLTMYTNSMRYQVSEQISARADVSLVYSPFSSLGTTFQKDIAGIYLNRAQVDYQPSKNFRVSLQYRNMPTYGYSPYSGYGGMFGGYGMYYGDGF